MHWGKTLYRALLRFLSSLRLGIILIALFALACIAGSIIAANEQLGVDYGREYVFHTWWFIGLMGLLLVNLCLCSWEKSYIALTLYKKRNSIASSAFYRKAAHAVAFPWRGSLDPVETRLRKKYTVVHQRGAAFYAQKGLTGRLGATIIHIGLLWTMLAGYYRILADDFGWGVYDATVILPEGEQTGIYHTRIDRLKDTSADNMTPREMPFSLRALDFTAHYFPHSTVAKYFSSLVELKDGDKSEIHEISMTQPLVYKGYKITQVSYSANERVKRGKYRVTDRESGDFFEVDAVPGDPVRVRLPNKENLFLQVHGMEAGAEYDLVDLVTRSPIQRGSIQAVHSVAEGPIPVDLEQFQEKLAQHPYAVLVAALFPNFTFDENQQPTTKDESFENPAVLVMLFKHGKPNGYTWLFLNEAAQEIVGQPHPEMDLRFVQYRKREGAGAPPGLYDYEVELELREKSTGKVLGNQWLKAGDVSGIANVSPQVLYAPNIRMGSAAKEHGNFQDRPQPAVADPATTAGGAGPQSASAGGGEVPVPQSRYQVTYLGPTTGHVTFLGYMKDPSVAWLFTGCLIIIGGTLIAFMLVYREVWVYYDEAEGLLYMATAVRGTSPAAHREFDRFAAEVAALAPQLPDDEEFQRLPAAEAVV